MAEELTIGAGAAPAENVLKPIKLAFEKSTKIDLSIIASGPKQVFIDLER
jgi:phosphate transport system substrate-binding protein